MQLVRQLLATGSPLIDAWSTIRAAMRCSVSRIWMVSVGATRSRAGPYPEIWSGGGGSSAEGSPMEAPKAPTRVGSGECAPSEEKFWHVLLRNGAF